MFEDLWDIIVNKNLFWIAPLIIMFIGLMPMPYGFYTLLRVVVFVCSLYFLFEFINIEDNTFVWIFGFLALLYNPIVPITLGSKGLWVIVNIITAGIFLISKDKI